MQRTYPSTASDIYAFGFIICEMAIGKPILTFIKTLDELTELVGSGQREHIDEERTVASGKITIPQKIKLLVQWSWFGEEGTHRPAARRLSALLDTGINEGI